MSSTTQTPSHSTTQANASNRRRYPVTEGGEPLSLEGSGPRKRIGIVFLHGFTARPSSVAPTARALHQHGFSVEVPRLPGHGTDMRDILDFEYSDWRRHAREVTLSLAERVTKLVVTGLSMGGTLAVDLGTENLPKVAGIAPINAQILNREGLGIRLAPLIGKLFPLVPPRLGGLRPNDVKKPGVAEHAYPLTPVRAGYSLVQAIPDIRARLPEVRVPVLVIRSRQDHSVSPENSIALAKALVNTEVSELILENSYHVATLDYDADLIVERLTRFADRVGGV